MRYTQFSIFRSTLQSSFSTEIGLLPPNTTRIWRNLFHLLHSCRSELQLATSLNPRNLRRYRKFVIQKLSKIHTLLLLGLGRDQEVA